MINKNILNTASKLSKLNKAYSQNKCRIIDDKVYNSKFLFYHYFYWSSEFYEDYFRNILVDYFDKSEKSYPGSSHMLSVKLCNKVYGIDNKKEKIKTDKSFNNILSYLETLCSKKAFMLFKNIIEFSGADATITCEKTNNNNIEVIKVCKPKFNFNLDKSFKEIYFKNIKKTTKNFLVCVLDCYIERESEIFSLIEYAKKNSVPVVIVCRGMSDNAKRNLKNILLRNSVLVYPYIEKYNNDDPFKINDFSEIIGAKIISAEAGDNINKSLIEKSSYVSCTLTENYIETSSKNKVLEEKINKQINENLSNNDLLFYLRKRKSRCSPNNTIVRIPKNEITLLNEIKNLIKCYNFCAIKGVYTNSNNIIQSVQCEKITDVLSKKLYESMTNISYKIKIGENNACV